MRVAVVTPPGLLGPYLRRALEPLGHEVDIFGGVDAAANGVEREHEICLLEQVSRLIQRMIRRKSVNGATDAREDATAPGHQNLRR